MPKGRKRKASEPLPDSDTGPAKTKPTRNVATNASKVTKRKASEPVLSTVIQTKTKKVVEPTVKLHTPNISSSNDTKATAAWDFKISSWNVAGLRAWVKKNGISFVDIENPDIFCLQETKCLESEVPPEANNVVGYHKFWHGVKGGQGGVALYSKKLPYEVTYGIGDTQFDNEARVITATYTKFFLVCVYVPNSGRGLTNLKKRMLWDARFQSYLTELDAKKPVIICGDMNVAHQEIDLANPKTNKKNAGFTQEERDGMTELISKGFIDTYRHLYPERKSYTFWTFMSNARAKNVGWRLDYFLVSQRMVQNVVDNVIHDSVMGSDHCPITLLMKF